MDTYTAANPLPMRFPATSPPVKGDHIDVGVWPNGWAFMRQQDRDRFASLPVEGDYGQEALRRAFDGQGAALAERQADDEVA